VTRATRPVASLDEIREWGATVDLATASTRAFGISKSYGHELANRGEYPCRVLKVGRRWRVPTSAILAALDHGPAGETA
jgi:hypothetical protein